MGHRVEVGPNNILNMQDFYSPPGPTTQSPKSPVTETLGEKPAFRGLL
jgi:hypothetical protein